MKVFLLLLIFFNYIFSQEFSYKNISVSDGLPSNEVYTVIQDNKGYIWCSTDAGIAKYNGREFKTFTTDNGLPYNTVFNLYEDQNHKIWGSSFDGSLFYIYNDSITIIPGNTGLIQLLKNGKDLVLNINVDSDNTVWLGTTKSLIRIDYPYTKALKINRDNEEKDSYLNIMFNDNIITCWIQPGNEFFKKNIPDKFKLFSIPSLSGLKLPFIRAAKSKNHIILATDNRIYTIQDDSIKLIKEYEQRIYSLFSLDNNKLFVGLSKIGYDLIDIDKKTGFKGLEGKSISGFCKDYEGGIWISTLNDGIFHIPEMNLLKENSLVNMNYEISGLGSLKNQLIIASNYKNEVSLVDSNYNVDVIFTQNLSFLINSHFLHKNNLLYVSGPQAFVYDLKAKKYEFIIDSKTMISPIFNRSLTTDNEYVYSIDYIGVNIIDKNYSKPYLKIPSRPLDCYTDSKKDLYIGTTKGLYKYKDSLEYISLLKDTSIAIKISHIGEYKNMLFVCTQNQGVFCNINSNWVNFKTQHGLSSNVVNHYSVINDSTIAIATNMGVDIFEVTKNNIYKIRVLNQNNGLDCEQVTKMVFWGGKLWIGTKKGLYSYKYQARKTNVYDTKIHIHSIYVNDKLSNLENLKSDDNNIKVNVDILSYKKNNVIKYKLSPRDNTYTYTSNTELVFDNLNPNSYVLELIGINGAGIKSDVIYIFFKIPTPWHQSYWFYLLCGGLFIIIVYLFTRWRVKSITTKNKKELEIEKQISELQSSALRSQMNPHFIFNVLNSIQHFILIGNNDEANEYLSKFSKLVRKVLNNSRNETISLDEEITTLKLFIELEQMRFDKSFEFILTIDKDIIPSQILIAPMIIQPFIENAIWHGLMPLKEEPNFTGKIEVTIFTNDSLNIIIKDNGIGINTESNNNHSTTSLGTEIVRQRLKKVGEEFGYKYVSLSNQTGTIVELKLPLLYEN